MVMSGGRVTSDMTLETVDGLEVMLDQSRHLDFPVFDVDNHLEDLAPGSFDIVVNGTLSTKGLWTNDFGASADQMQGSAYTNGGSVVLIGRNGARS